MHDNDEKLRLIAQGNELSHGGRFFEARQCFFKAREIDPTCPQIQIAELNNDALRCRRTSDFSGAIKIYRKVLKLSSKDVHALLSIGILMRETDPTAALKYLEKALALEPNNAGIWRVKGWCYRELNDLERELESYYEAQKIEPSIMIQRWIDGVKNRLRKTLQGECDPQFLPRLQNYFIKILNSEGLHHVLAEDYDAAVKCYREVLSLEPESILAQNAVIDVLLKRSEQLMRFRRFDEARTDVAQVLQMNSNHEVALQCKAQDARITLMEEIAGRKKDSVSRTSSANDFWASERSGMKRSGSETDKDANTRSLKKT